jgi:hypothetical protein
MYWVGCGSGRRFARKPISFERIVVPQGSDSLADVTLVSLDGPDLSRMLSRLRLTASRFISRMRRDGN